MSCILEELSAVSLARRFGAPLDAARAAFPLSSVFVVEPDEFDRLVCALYASLARAVGLQPEESNMYFESKALATLARAFAQEHGLDGARAEARDAVRGGMRFVLDRLVNQVKHELQSEHTRYILSVAVESRPFSDRCVLAQQLGDLMQSNMPAWAR